ncbi:hypothetical protein EV715DRAFT_203832, partial [Schizophyllum commune]
MATSASPATGELSATTVTITSATTTVTVNAGSPMATITVAPTTDRRATRTARPASPTLVSGAGWFQRSHPLRRLVRRSRDRTEPQDLIVDERAGSLPTVPAHAKEPPPAPQLTPAAPEPQPATELDPAPRPQPAMDITPARERTPTLEPAPEPERPSSSNTTAGNLASTTPASALGDQLGPSAHSPSKAQVSDARMTQLWEEAIKQYEKESKRKLSTLEADGLVLNSKTSIEEYIRRNCDQSGAKKSVDYFLPVAKTIENLCDPLANIVSAAFPPASAIFSAIGILVEALQATISVKEDFQTACSAFETMDFHLQVIGSTANVEMDDTLRKVFVRILAQILAVFGVITKLRRDARIKTWLQRLCDTSSRVSAAMQDLGELVKQQHLSMSAATLGKTDKILTALKDAVADGAQEHAHTHMFVDFIASIAQKTYDVGEANRGLLEKLQEALLEHRSDMGRLITDDSKKHFLVLRAITRWLHFPNPSSRLNTLLKDRLASTGSWFLDGPDFSAFKEATRRHLVVHGKGEFLRIKLVSSNRKPAFCGKSTLMAAAVRDLRASCLLAGMDAVVLVHLFDIVNPMQEERNLASLLSSLLCQLALERAEALTKLTQLQSRHARGRSDPPLESMQTTQVARDIVMLLDSKFSAGGALASARKEDEQQIRNTVTHRADGNFLWAKVVLQDMESVVDSPSLISSRLEAVPETVDEHYAKRLRSIPAVDQKTVRHLLMWVVLSYGNFSKEEFARLLCFDYSSEPPQYRFQLNSPEAAVNLVGSTFL